MSAYIFSSSKACAHGWVLRRAVSERDRKYAYRATWEAALRVLLWFLSWLKYSAWVSFKKKDAADTCSRTELVTTQADLSNPIWIFTLSPLSEGRGERIKMAVKEKKSNKSDIAWYCVYQKGINRPLQLWTNSVFCSPGNLTNFVLLLACRSYKFSLACIVLCFPSDILDI